MSDPESGPNPDFADTVRGYWDRLETTTSPFMGLITCGNGGGVEAHYRHAEELRTFLSLVPVKSQMRILELGCGNGRWIASLAPKLKHYEGIDFSEQMVAQARELARIKHLKNVNITQCKVEDFRPAAVFDIIYVSGVSLYISDEELVNVAERMRAHLKPGGLVVERSTFHRKSRDTITYRAADSYAAIYRTSQELVDIFAKGGLAIKAMKQSYTYMHLPNRIIELLNRSAVRRAVRAGAPLTYPILRHLSAAYTAKHGYPGDMSFQSHEFLVFESK